MSAPTFAGQPRPDLAPTDEPGFYRDRDGNVYLADSAPSNGNGRAPSKLRRLDVARMVRENPPAVPWIIEGLVVRGALTIFNGREGEGKSLLAMALAAGVDHGENQAGMGCNAGRVLIVDAENGPWETHRRVHALGLPGTVEMFEPADGKRFDLRTDLGDLDRLLAEHRPDLLILDSFRTLWGGEENDSGDVAKVLDPLRNLVRKHGAGTILLHHSGKGNGGYRGSSAIGASAELGFTLARDPRDEPGQLDADPNRRSLTCWKCRPAPKPARTWLRLSVERDMVLIDETAPPETEPPARAPVTSSLKPQVLAVLTDEPQPRADIARTVGRNPKDRTVGRVLADLAAEGEAERTGPENRPLWKVASAPGRAQPKSPENQAFSKVAGGKHPSTDATCHLVEVIGGVTDTPTIEGFAPTPIGPAPWEPGGPDWEPYRGEPERPDDAIPALACRCERPIPQEDEDGVRFCGKCGRWIA